MDGVAERLLPGEPEDATELEDVDLWVEVYTELCETLRRMLSKLDPAPVEVMRHLGSLERRRQLWVSRRDQISGQRQTTEV
jgi:hypothetical protein